MRCYTSRSHKNPTPFGQPTSLSPTRITCLHTSIHYGVPKNKKKQRSQKGRAFGFSQFPLPHRTPKRLPYLLVQGCIIVINGKAVAYREGPKPVPTQAKPVFIGQVWPFHVEDSSRRFLTTNFLDQSCIPSCVVIHPKVHHFTPTTTINSFLNCWDFTIKIRNPKVRPWIYLQPIANLEASTL